MSQKSEVKYYQWFMTEEHTQRIVGYEWHPEEGEGPDSDMASGRLTFMKREEPGDTWERPVEIGFLPLIAARSLAQSQGFSVEVPVTE